jgi:phosphoribosylaminoimidazole-succinocarboxamide synthase
MLVRRAQMIPLEVVVRGVAAGSLVRRKPGIARGAMLVPRMIEFFLKDDANHDPLIEPDAIVARGIATPQELGDDERARAHHLRDPRARVAPHETLLVDLKIEFGRSRAARARASS